MLFTGNLLVTDSEGKCTYCNVNVISAQGFQEDLSQMKETLDGQCQHIQKIVIGMHERSILLLNLFWFVPLLRFHISTT